MSAATLSAAVRRMLPETSAGRRLSMMAIVDAIGTGLFLAASTLFFTRAVGLSGEQLGFGLALAGIVSLVTTVPIGLLADRLGPRRVLIALSLWRAAGLAAYALVQDFYAFLLVVCLLGVADKAASPVLQALVSRAAGETDRVRTMAIIRAVRNVGFTIGAALASLAIAIDSRPAYLIVLFANSASFMFVAAVVRTVPMWAMVAPPTQTATVIKHPSLFRALSNVPYLTVAALNAGLTIHMTLLAIGMPLWVSQHTRAPLTLVSVLVVVNTVLAVLFQVRASRGSDTVPGAARAQYRAGVALAVCCVLFALAAELSGSLASVVLVAAMLALTAGELFQSAGGWGLSYQLADPHRQGACLALFSLGSSVQQIVAPLLIAGPVIGSGALGWLALGAGLFVCGAASVGVARWSTALAARSGVAVAP
jgi:MFS family permease